MPQKFPSLTRLTPPNNVYLGWSNLYLGLLLHEWWMRHGWWGQHTKTGNRVPSVYFKDVIKHQWKLTTSGSYSSKVGTNHTFFISGDHQVCSLEKSLEMLGSSKMFFFVCSQQQMLDCGSPCQKRPPSPGSLPLLRPGRRKYSTHPPHLMWVCKAGLDLDLPEIKILTVMAPESTSRFCGWWCHTLRSVPKEMRKGLNSLIILVVWELWKHRNACAF